MMTNDVKRPFSNRDRIGYALGDMGCNLSFSLLSTYMMLLPSVIYGKDNKLMGDRFFYIAIVFSVLGFLILLAMRKMIAERVEYSGEAPDTNCIKTVKSFFTNRAMVGATLATVASVVFFTSTVSVNNLVFQKARTGCRLCRRCTFTEHYRLR